MLEALRSGRAELCMENSLNGAHCWRIIGREGRRACNRPPLHSSRPALSRLAWCRGEAPKGLVAACCADGRRSPNRRLTIAGPAGQGLPISGQPWQEHRFELMADSAADQATIQIGLRGKGRCGSIR